MSLLDKINSPQDLKTLSVEELTTYAGEIRNFLIQKVSATGGHLGPNLGVVELTIALHRVFNSPQDVIIFDTGHQTYVHKIITGRAKQFDKLRKKNGLSGYPSRKESPHDWVESSHASSSLSVAYGMAKAFQLSNQNRKVIVVIGDGALTGGMAWEALNNIASSNLPLVIIVNDNGRSYAPTVGGLATHLSNLRMANTYEKAVNSTKNILNKTPLFGKHLYRLLHGFKVGLKDVVIPETVFANLGMKYLGPVYGHNIQMIENNLQLAKSYASPVILHLVTQKGHGYYFAEHDKDDQMHSTGVINPSTGKPKKLGQLDWTTVFADTLVAAGKADPNVVALTAAMSIPTGIYKFAELFPERTLDVGIAEQHAITTASGLALAGKHPLVAIYSTFFNRGFDQFLMDVALLKLPVTLVLDRAGITGNDGPSHNGMWDLSLLSIIPDIRVAAPRDGKRLKKQLVEALHESNMPTVLRFPKGPVPNNVEAVSSLGDGLDVLYASEKEVTRKKKILIIAVGSFVPTSLEVAALIEQEGYSVTVVDPGWIFPINEILVDQAAKYDYLVTLEDNLVDNGFGSLLVNKLLEQNIPVRAKIIGLPKKFIEQADRVVVLQDLLLDTPQLVDRIMLWLDLNH